MEFEEINKIRFVFIAEHFTSLSIFAHLHLIYDISLVLIQSLRGGFLFQCL